MRRFWPFLFLLLQQRPESPLTTLSVNVRMVEVYASVYNQKGQRVQNLGVEAFEIEEDGVRQKIEVFEPQTAGLSVALLMDTTGSMVRQLPQVKMAITDLLGRMSPDDKAGLFSFSNTLKTLQPFTNDRSAVLSALQSARADGGTALYDSLAQLARDLSKTGGKKAILLFTDGSDNSSVLGLQKAAAAIRRVGVPIYTIAQGELLKSFAGLKRLQEIAKETNGIAFEARTTGDLRRILVRIDEDLKHMYLLSYYSTNPDSKSDFRRISVVLPGHPDLKLRAKQGYYR